MSLIPQTLLIFRHLDYYKDREFDEEAWANIEAVRKLSILNTAKRIRKFPNNLFNSDCMEGNKCIHCGGKPVRYRKDRP